jgi:hypothetical protein
MMASVASGGLESMLHNPAYALVGACVAGAAVAGEYIPVDGWRKRMSDGYLSLCERMRSKKKF